MPIKNIYNVLIIGAGEIGAFFDNPESEFIFTHAHAFRSHTGFQLLGFVDINKNKAQKAVSIWGGEVFNNFDEAFKHNKVDLAVIAVPDRYHFEILSKIVKFPVKFVFTEKPMVQNLIQANKIKNLYLKKGIPLSVNYTRRFIPEFIRIKRDIKDNKYGNFITGSGYYGRGFLNGGSHTIDFIRWYLGEIKKFQIVDRGYDFSKEDPSISVLLHLNNNKKFYLQYVDFKSFQIYEIDLLFEKKRIIVKNGGFTIEEYDIQKNVMLKGRKSPVMMREISTNANTSMLFAVNNIFNFLSNKTKLESDLESGYKTTKICLEIINSVKH